MNAEVSYLLMVVATGWAVTFGLRALPFLLFAGKDRQLPAWVEKFGSFVSPVIIGGLIVYSYATLKLGEGETAKAAWKTAWPYLAGALTVGLQLWKRNPLASIIAGTVVYMLLLNCGCTTYREVPVDAQHTVIRVKPDGIYFEERRIAPQALPEILDDLEVPRQREVHLKIDREVADLGEARLAMGCLAKAGYERSVLVTERHAEAVVTGKKRPPAKAGAASARPAPKRIRYKKANE